MSHQSSGKNRRNRAGIVRGKNRAYAGGVVAAALSRAVNSTDMITRVFTVEGTLVSSGAGVFNAIYSLNPSGIGDFTTLAPLYDEFRIMGGRIKFFCAQQNSLTVASVPITAVYDNDDASTSLTTYANALDYRVKIQFASVWDNQGFPSLRFTCFSQGNSGVGPLWITTGAPGTYPKSIKMYGTGATASTTYCQYTLEIVCQMRGPT
jgi:hypothetical protein